MADPLDEPLAAPLPLVADSGSHEGHMVIICGGDECPRRLKGRNKDGWGFAKWRGSVVIVCFAGEVEVSRKNKEKREFLVFYM